MTAADSAPSVSASRLWASSLPAFAVMFGTLYAAYGSESPFFPAFLASRGLTPIEVGSALGVWTGVKLVAAPLAGRLADRLGAPRLVLAACLAGTGLIGLAFLQTTGLWPVLLVIIAWSVVIAPLAPLADTLALAASSGERGYPYGWVRGVGSGAFVGGTLLAGPIIDRFGLSSIVWLSGALFGLTALCALRVSASNRPRSDTPSGSLEAISKLLRQPAYRAILVVVALIMGSHAMSDAFAVIHWREAGISSTMISLLWSDAVLAEVGVFFVLGPILLRRFDAAGCAALAAAAGILRWSVMALTTAVPAIAAVQALHGFTFALLHLTAMQVISRVVPQDQAATAQTIYGAVAVGIPTVLVTLVSGPLYGRFGALAFLSMAGLCGLALPFTAGLRRTGRG